MDILRPTSFNVLLIGDSCEDKFIYGRCNRLNPEAPVPVLDYIREEIKGGMCLNVASNLKSFGINVDVFTNQEKILKTRYIDEVSNQQLLRVDFDQQIKPFDSVINFDLYDAIVISDYNKGFITEDFLSYITSIRKCPIFIDSKKTNLPTKNCFIKINELEYSKIKNPSDNIIVTLGGKGCFYKNILYKTKKVETRDIVGAGDTFLSALIFGYLYYGSIEKAIPLANSAARISVSYPGIYTLTKKDVSKIINICS
jgi:D-glycero-beta-D-manno-heptose-7-phosphate kinase